MSQKLTNNKTIINTTNFSKGIYLVKIISDENKIFYKKLIIE